MCDRHNFNILMTFSVLVLSDKWYIRDIFLFWHQRQLIQVKPRRVETG